MHTLKQSQFSFERLEVWRIAMEALRAIKELQFKRFGDLKQQLDRAALSIVANLAEGVGKGGGGSEALLRNRARQHVRKRRAGRKRVRARPHRRGRSDERANAALAGRSNAHANDALSSSRSRSPSRPRPRPRPRPPTRGIVWSPP